MLVLTRNKSESIIIGKDLIKLKVLEVQGQSVRIGIEAPKELSIHREEIYQRILNNNDDNQPPKVEKKLVIKKPKVSRTIKQPDMTVSSMGCINQSEKE